MWYDGSHDDGSYDTTAQHVFFGAGVYTIDAWAIDDAGLPSQVFLQRTVVVHAAAACDPGAPLSVEVAPQAAVYDIRLNNPGCTDVKVPSLTVHLPAGFSIQPGETQQQLHSIADPVASDAGRTLAWPDIDILMPKDNAPVTLRLWWQDRPAAPGTYPSQVVLDTGAGQIVVDAPIVVGLERAEVAAFGALDRGVAVADGVLGGAGGGDLAIVLLGRDQLADDEAADRADDGRRHPPPDRGVGARGRVDQAERRQHDQGSQRRDR